MWYSSSNYRSPTSNISSVNARAAKVHDEYIAKARQVDATYNNTPHGVDGPMYTRMLSFGRIQGFVFGSWGEVSQDVRSFLTLVANQSAHKLWRQIDRARSIQDIQGVIKHRFRRILGITAIRSAQFLKTQRLSHITGDFQRSRKRSTQARSYFQAWSAEYDNCFGPRTWRPQYTRST